MATKTVKLIAKTHRAGSKLNGLFKQYPRWNGEWFVLNTQDWVGFAKGERGPWLLIAPIGHPWDKFERWVHSTNDINFTVREVTV